MNAILEQVKSGEAWPDPFDREHFLVSRKGAAALLGYSLCGIDNLIRQGKLNYLVRRYKAKRVFSSKTLIDFAKLEVN